MRATAIHITTMKAALHFLLIGLLFHQLLELAVIVVTNTTEHPSKLLNVNQPICCRHHSHTHGADWHRHADYCCQIAGLVVEGGMRGTSTSATGSHHSPACGIIVNIASSSMMIMGTTSSCQHISGSTAQYGSTSIALHSRRQTAVSASSHDKRTWRHEHPRPCTSFEKHRPIRMGPLFMSALAVTLRTADSVDDNGSKHHKVVMAAKASHVSTGPDNMVSQNLGTTTSEHNSATVKHHL